MHHHQPVSTRDPLVSELRTLTLGECLDFVGVTKIDTAVADGDINVADESFSFFLMQLFMYYVSLSLILLVPCFSLIYGCFQHNFQTDVVGNKIKT